MPVNDTRPVFEITEQRLMDSGAIANPYLEHELVHACLAVFPSAVIDDLTTILLSCLCCNNGRRLGPYDSIFAILRSLRTDVAPCLL